MRHDELYLWHIPGPEQHRCVGRLRLVVSGRGLRVGADSHDARSARLRGLERTAGHLGLPR